MGIFKKDKTPKPKEVKLCKNESDHDWYEIGKCKDALGKHPCKYFPEGCATCLTRFECYTKDDPDKYRRRLTGVFYACKKCPAIAVEGEIYSWDRHRWHDILDIRTHSWIGMEDAIIKEQQERWKKNEP